jgi:predicted permease
MRALRRFFVRLTTTATRRRDDERLREELDDHIAFQMEENVRAGMPPDEARRQALITVGGGERLREAYRDEQGLPTLESLLQDIRFALRRMKQAPGFTAAAVGTLALGLGLNSAVLSLAYGLFLKPLPVDGASRLVIVNRVFEGDARRGFPISFPDYVYYRDHAHAFSGLAAHYSTSPMNIITPGGPMSGMGAVVTANYFDLLRLRPAMGRFFLAEEDQVPGRDAVVVLSYDMWRTRFGADGAILGKIVRVNGTAFSVVGVAPEGFHGVFMGLPPNDVWIPSAMFSVGYRYCNGLARGCNVIDIIGRLNDGFTVQDAQSEVNVLTDQIQAMFPATDNVRRSVEIRPALGIRLMEQQQDAPIVRLLAGAAALVLIIASANVAGLMLARGLRRRKELAIRLALGAGRARLVRLLLVESIALAVAGGGAGLLVSVLATGVLRGYFGQPGVQNTLDLSLDLRVVLASFAVAALTGIVTGISPALQSTRPDTVGAMKEESAGAGTRRSLLRDGLTVVQVALSIVLLGSSGLLVRSFLLLHRGPGFDPDAIAIVRLRPSLVGYTNDRAWAFQREAIRRLEAMPGVVSASPAVVAPLPGWGRPAMPVRVDGDTTGPSAAFRTSTTFVGPRYFNTLGAGLTAGREFEDRDTATSPRVAIVNEALARRLWPKGNAIGSHATIGRTSCEIVGIVKDLQWLSAFEAPEPIAYLNFWQQDRSNSWSQDSRTHIRIAGGATLAILPEIRRTIAAIDPDVPINESQLLGRLLDTQFAAVRATRTMFLVFGGLALLLSAIGLYATLAFAIGQRTREIAVRMALGASRTDVGGLVFRRGSAMFAIGALAGLAACVFAGPLLAHLLYGVSPRDPVALLAGPLVLGFVAVLAIWLPARRAMRLDPVTALRTE